MKRFYLFLGAIVFVLGAWAQSTTLLQNVYARDITSLNGSWKAIVDPFDNGFYNYRLVENPNGFFKDQKPRDKSDLVEYSFDTAPQLLVPGDWNTQDEKLFYYEGSIWYKKDFNYTKKANTRLYLYFGAVNYLANVYLNGKPLGSHEGGFTSFHFDITDQVKDGHNFVVLRVNNVRKPEGVPTVNSDWWNYGGITRDVLLVETPEISVDDYLVQLPKGRYNEVSGYIQLNKPQAGVAVSLKIPELKISKKLLTDAKGKASFSYKAKPKLWTPENPKLYDVEIDNGDEVLRDRIGFRQIETQGKNLLLNGKKTFLRGISIHEEAPYRQGRIFSKEESEILLGWAKELGCNFVRLAHYPHNEHMVRAAEEMGLMVWSEIPVYWTIHWDNPDTYKNASAQLKNMMDRDKNRCAVIIWSVANETPHSDARDKFLAGLAHQVRAADNTRLLSMAMEVAGTKGNVSLVKDYMSRYVDIISFNNYLGWYGGTPEDCKTRQWEIPYDKPFFISEFGGGALQGMHGDKKERWTEEYQAELYKNTLDMYNRVDGFAGTSPWILMDFRSPRRQLNGIQDFFNRKGIISERGQKKEAFYVLQNFYKMKKEAFEKNGKK
ncbi:glycoside hydrolase family 2 TIM barrel-domain containing protein [uncultured Bacteroides sp.]|uniref:glycoside hydrolase family 2 protein n=1 Tax=uncultured Bacteroides sp. TaxID=162156 RepID=UPI002AABBA73|nr:glycoside hydrolase family 2 TIM barrel-domain containing protein [uncultured Bacteroides sp.]